MLYILPNYNLGIFYKFFDAAWKESKNRGSMVLLYWWRE